MAEPRELFPIVMGRGKSPVSVNMVSGSQALQADLEATPEPPEQELALIEAEGKVKSTGTPAKS